MGSCSLRECYHISLAHVHTHEIFIRRPIGHISSSFIINICVVDFYPCCPAILIDKGNALLVMREASLLSSLSMQNYNWHKKQLATCVCVTELIQLSEFD